MRAGVKLKVNGIGMGVFAVCSSGLAVSQMCKDSYATEEETPATPRPPMWTVLYVTAVMMSSEAEYGVKQSSLGNTQTLNSPGGFLLYCVSHWPRPLWIVTHQISINGRAVVSLLL